MSYASDPNRKLMKIEYYVSCAAQIIAITKQLLTWLTRHGAGVCTNGSDNVSVLHF